jgi:hypothetical protein
MTKMIKMSLVAAVAVAGLSSTVAAKPLEEAIKGVDVSGMIRYQLENTAQDKADNTEANIYDAEMTVKSKINDMATAVLKFDVTGTTSDAPADGTAGNAGDAKPSVNLEDVYFSVNAGFATINAGKQNIPGPYTDGAQGTGIVALAPVGGVTLAGGHFSNYSIDGFANANANELALIVPAAGPVTNLQAWYVSVTDVITGLTVSGDIKAGPVNVAVRHTTTSLDSKVQAEKGDASLTKVVASGKAGAISYVAGLAMTGADNSDGKGGANSTLNRVAVDNDNDAETDFKVWQASVAGLNDATAILVGASTTVAPNTTAGLKYVTASYGSSTRNDGGEVSEVLLDASYAMSANFKLSAKYSTLASKTKAATAEDKTKTRIEVKYTF